LIVAKRKRPDFRLEDVIGVFRALEESDDAIVVLGDEQAMKVLVAWSHTDQEWERPSTPVPPTTHGKLGKLWAWVVSGWDVDEQAIARLAGVPRSVAHEKLAVLIGNRLVYPDGTIAKGGRQALGVYTARKLGIKQRSRPEPPRAPNKDDGNQGN
jgi:hypothetical protein